MDNWNINYMSAIPLNKQLEKKIIASIRRGELKRGDCIPSAKGLSQTLLLSLATTTKVYRRLLKEGILNHDKDFGYRIASDLNHVETK